MRNYGVFRKENNSRAFKLCFHPTTLRKQRKGALQPGSEMEKTPKLENNNKHLGASAILIPTNPAHFFVAILSLDEKNCILELRNTIVVSSV